jgi:hypothetical protein
MIKICRERLKRGHIVFCGTPVRKSIKDYQEEKKRHQARLDELTKIMTA